MFYFGFKLVPPILPTRDSTHMQSAALKLKLY